MMGRSHLLLAGGAYAALALRPLETPLGTLRAPLLSGAALAEPAAAFALSLGLAAACGLAPDLDKAGSTAARSFGLPSRLLAWGLERSFGHRGGLHSLTGLALGYLAGDLLGALLGLHGLGALVAFGWAVHLLTDAWTVRGVPLFWPLVTTSISLPPWISTGTWKESVALTVSLLGLLAYATAGRWPAG
jgi:membrane-bound metal-dependent hydrolase YbcI (DUF457 family)